MKKKVLLAASITVALIAGGAGAYYVSELLADETSTIIFEYDGTVGGSGTFLGEFQAYRDMEISWNSTPHIEVRVRWVSDGETVWWGSGRDNTDPRAANNTIQINHADEGRLLEVWTRQYGLEEGERFSVHLVVRAIG
ncbi:MAG: hypothetical protein LN415_00555 [Candidatus Thermoplasmatota archaeon]|nr:hypothetical protein [Candidatus Thermoplasmatota archaeon]